MAIDPIAEQDKARTYGERLIRDWAVDTRRMGWAISNAAQLVGLAHYIDKKLVANGEA